MARVALVQASFDRMIRDMPRDRLPKGSCWDILDYIPNELGAPLAKRGGWTYASQSLTTVHAGSDMAQGVIAAPFATGEQIVAYSRDTGTSSRIVQVVSSSSTTDRGAGFNDDLGQAPIFYRNYVYFVGQSGGSTPYRYDGTSSALLTGSPPTGSRATVYKDRLVLARSSAQPQRLWFSGPGTPTTWDITYGWIDTSGQVQAIYALRNAILIFHNTYLERIIGTTPPPGGDMSVQPLFDTGSTYPFSLAGSDEFVCFCNQGGVHMTDGSAVVDLTEQGGMTSYWRSLFTGGRHIAAGFVRGYYVVSVWDAASPYNFVDAFLIQLRTRRFTRISNVQAYSFSIAPSSSDELHWASRAIPRINTLTTIFSPTAATKNDGDGDSIAPVVELPYQTLAQSEARIDQAYLRYDLRDAAADNPTLTMSYVLDPTSTSYTEVAGEDGNAYPLAETSEITRIRRNVRQRGFGIAIKLTQQNPSEQTRINTFELESRPREESAV